MTKGLFRSWYDYEKSSTNFRAKLERDHPWAIQFAHKGASTVGPGWHQVFWQLFETLERECTPEELAAITVEDVKEKYGFLRIYVRVDTGSRARDEVICDLITAAEEVTMEICDICGKPGTIRTDGWHRCRCDQHEPHMPPED